MIQRDGSDASRAGPIGSRSANTLSFEAQSDRQASRAGPCVFETMYTRGTALRTMLQLRIIIQYVNYDRAPGVDLVTTDLVIKACGAAGLRYIESELGVRGAVFL